jgi:hypothetical protein
MDIGKPPANATLQNLLGNLVQALDLLHPRHPDGDEDCFINATRREAEATITQLKMEGTLHCAGCQGETADLQHLGSGDRLVRRGSGCPGVSFDPPSREGHA